MKKDLSASILGFAAALIMGSCATGAKPLGAASAPGRGASPDASQTISKPAPALSGRVAIFDFEVKGGGDAYASLKGDIPESLSEAFIKGGRIVPVERRDLEKALVEQELQLSGIVDDATAARVGRLAGARYALLGTASIIAEQIRVACRLIDIETGEIVYAESARGETKDIYGVLDALAAKVEGGSSE